MKKTAALVLGLLLCLAALTAAGGSGGDPLISRSYLEGAFSQSLEDAVNSRLDAADAEVRSGLDRASPALPGEDAGPVWEYTLKEGDILSGVTGMSLTLLGGEARLDLSGGAVVDVTAGTEVLAGGTLEVNHRYIVAENTVADITVSSPAAVLSCAGGGSLTLSLSPDYFAMASALRTLGLFRGTGSGFGGGFDLHLSPTRGEGLVMFLRILGEEDAALACTGTHPFTDVPGWLDRYVAWAYEKGYANGVSPDRFGCQQKLSAVEYEEFLLRALGYSVAGVDDYTTSLERALNRGVLTGGEYAMLRSQTFLRAHVAYISYYALDAACGDGQTLAQRLTAAGVMTAEQLTAARSTVDSLRVA